MSVIVTTDVMCSVCGHWVHYCTGARAHIRQAQWAAKKSGWTFDRRARAICPECNGSRKRGEYWGWGGLDSPTLPR